jgi:hypothetical protein
VVAPATIANMPPTVGFHVFSILYLSLLSFTLRYSWKLPLSIPQKLLHKASSYPQTSLSWQVV